MDAQGVFTGDRSSRLRKFISRLSLPLINTLPLTINAKWAKLNTGLAFAASDAMAYLMAVDKRKPIADVIKTIYTIIS